MSLSRRCCWGWYALRASTCHELDLARINLADPDVFLGEDADAAFRYLRKNDPVHWTPPGEITNGFWSMTEYEHVVFVSRHQELFISGKGIAGPGVRPDAVISATSEMITQAQRSGGNVSIVTMDPPQHVKMRRLVQKGFTPRAVNAMEPQIREVTNRILDKIADRGSCDSESGPVNCLWP